MSGKKLKDNGLWESSRMMLPEHKEAINARRRNMHRKAQPEIDSAELERFSQLYFQSLYTGTYITLTLFMDGEERIVYGQVTRIDRDKAAIKLTDANGGSEWIHIRDIVGVE